MTPAHMLPAMPTEAAMRRAVAERDAALDGAFVYGVTSTAVYCRPSCASRPARPERLRFFATPDAAEAAGFRACKRCHPRDRDAATTRRMHALARYIEAHAAERLPLERLARTAHLSPTHLQRTFKAVLGVSPKAYQDSARLKRLKRGLKGGSSVLESIAEAGFESTSRVYGASTRSLGMTPSAYRAGSAGETIAYACRPTSLGLLMMAATDRGVCFAQFGADEDEVRAQLAAEFPRATLLESRMAASAELDAWIAAFEARLDHDGPPPELPLDLRGTAFQVRVWRFLLSIKPGEVMSYREVAAAIDAPKAVRAAASAIAANRIAVLVPCHRVLRSDGGIGGYRWGLERKRALLDQERRAR